MFKFYRAGAMIAALAILGFPSSGHADLAEDLMAVFDDALNVLAGDELDMSIGFDVTPPPPPWPLPPFDPVHIDMRLIGFAFCSPVDPWMDPIQVSPPFGIYDCENLSTCDALVTPDETQATLTVSVTDLFLDLESDRDETLYCLEAPPGIVTEPGYSIHDGTLTMTLALTWTGSCVQATLVPGSVIAEVDLKERDSLDECLIGAWSFVEPVMLPILEDMFATSFEEAVTAMMDPINEALCLVTPRDRVSWGETKSRFVPLR